MLYSPRRGCLVSLAGWSKVQQNKTVSETVSFTSATLLSYLFLLLCHVNTPPSTMFDTSAILVLHNNLLKLLCGALSDTANKTWLVACYTRQEHCLQYHTASTNLFVEFKREQTTNMCMKKLQAWSVKNARVLLRIASCPSKQNRKAGSHPIYEKHFSHSDALIILSIFSCFQFHLLLPPRSFSLKLGPIIKLWTSVSLQTHAYSFCIACQKTFGPQESFVRTQFWKLQQFYSWLPLKT